MRWALRRGRTWLVIAAATAATLLASRDHRTGWTIAVGIVTAMLAVAAIAGDYRDAHPGGEERRATKMQENVDAILWRYEREAAARRRAADSEDGT